MTKYYYTIINVIALSVIIYLGIDTFYTVGRAQLIQVNTEEITMKSTPDEKRVIDMPLTDLQSIMARNIFGSVDKASKEPDLSQLEDLEKTSLKVRLKATMPGDQQAVIEDTVKRKEEKYKVGDSIQEAVLKRVYWRRVVLSVEDRDEILEMEETSSPEPARARIPSRSSRTRPARTERTIAVNRSEIDESLADISKLMRDARFRPHTNKDGESDGFIVTGIKAGSIFRKMNLRNGDIIHGINGKPIMSGEEVFAMYSNLRSGSNISLQINRRGQERTLNYQFRE